MSNVMCDHFIEVDGDPWAGTYCKLLAGHAGDHSAHYPSGRSVVIDRDARIEAAARVEHSHDPPGRDGAHYGAGKIISWSRLTEYQRDQYRGRARATLTAADQIDDRRMVDRATAVIEWLLPFATYPECICEKTIGCECNVEEAQRNYEPTLEAARQWLRELAAADAVQGAQIAREDRLWTEMQAALADARTRATPQDQRVEVYWRERIRKALAETTQPADDRRMVDQAVELLRETSRLLHFQPVIPVAEERELRDAVDAFLRKFGGPASNEEK